MCSPHWKCETPKSPIAIDINRFIFSLFLYFEYRPEIWRHVHAQHGSKSEKKSLRQGIA